MLGLEGQVLGFGLGLGTQVLVNNTDNRYSSNTSKHSETAYLRHVMHLIAAAHHSQAPSCDIHENYKAITTVQTSPNLATV